MAEGGNPSTTDVTVTETVTEEQSTSPTLRLKLRKPKNDKKVQWTSGTVDNEHMGKKKSKCCCVYEKPKLFGESSSEDEGDDDCTKNCRGHKKKCYQTHGHDHNGEGPSEGGSGPSDGGGGLVSSS